MEPVERDDAVNKDASISIEFLVLYFIFYKLRIKISYNRSNTILPYTFIQITVDKNIK